MATFIGTAELWRVKVVRRNSGGRGGETPLLDLWTRSPQLGGDKKTRVLFCTAGVLP